MTAKEVQREAGHLFINAHVNTIKRSLRRSGIITHRPIQAPSLTSKIMKRRRIWADNLSNWSGVIFSDETAIQIQSSTSIFVRRRETDKIRTDHVRNRRCFHQKVMFLGSITSHGSGKIIPVEGNINSTKYISILASQLLPFLGDNVERFIFQKDNAPCHKANEVSKFFSNHGIFVLDWPPFSPDMNCIENVWGKLKEKVCKHSILNREWLIMFGTMMMNSMIFVNKLFHVCRA